MFEDSRVAGEGELGEGEFNGVVPVEEGFSSSASCVVRLSKSLTALRKEGLSMAQSGGHSADDSNPRELDLVLALSSRDVDEGLDSSGGLRV